MAKLATTVKGLHFVGVGSVKTPRAGKPEHDPLTRLVVLNKIPDWPVAASGPNPERFIECHGRPMLPRPEHVFARGKGVQARPDLFRWKIESA
jgi:hypothetical protein